MPLRARGLSGLPFPFFMVSPLPALVSAAGLSLRLLRKGVSAARAT